jgi:uncharacterized protein YdeI (YjbR/CyaY-like superfamily)
MEATNKNKLNGKKLNSINGIESIDQACPCDLSDKMNTGKGGGSQKTQELAPGILHRPEHTDHIPTTSSLSNRVQPLNTDKQRLLAAIKKNPDAFRDAPSSFRDDREVVLAAVERDGYTLFFASEELRGDKQVVLAAVGQNYNAIIFASEPLQSDKEVILCTVSQHANALQYVPEALRNDKDVMLAAVKKDGCALFFASKELQADQKVVLAAVSQNGLALEHASDALRNDLHVVLTAVCKNGLALQHASDAFRSKKQVILTAIKKAASAFELASKELQSEPEIIRTAMGGAKSWMNVFNREKVDHIAVGKTLGMTRSLPKKVFLDALEKSTSKLQEAFKELKDLKIICIDSKETIKHSLLDSRSVLLQAGWLEHAVWIHVLTDPKDPAQWAIRIFNAGDESGTNHSQVECNSFGQTKTKTAYVEWTGIAKTSENADKLITGLEQIADISGRRAAKMLYKDLADKLGAQTTKKLTQHQIDSAITSQRIGNCSVQSGHAALKAIDIEASREFMHTMRAEQIAIGKQWVAENPSLLEASADTEILEALEKLHHQKEKQRAEKGIRQASSFVPTFDPLSWIRTAHQVDLMSGNTFSSLTPSSVAHVLDPIQDTFDSISSFFVQKSSVQ